MAPPSDALSLAIRLTREFGMPPSASQGLVTTAIHDPDRFKAIEAELDAALMLEASHAASGKIEWKLPKGYFLTFADLLSVPSHRRTVPERFFVAEADVLYQEEASAAFLAAQPPGSTGAILREYLEAAALLSALVTCADHVPATGSQINLVFLHKRKLVISDEYAPEDLSELSGVQTFIDEYLANQEGQKHWDQKQTILRVTLEELFETETPVCFGALLRRYSELKNSVRSGYMLYVSEFSFVKIKEDVEKDKVEFIAKLNKVFADIQSQLLAIPAALILIGSQMERQGHWGIKNILIVLGAFVFAVLMDLLIRNQRHTLDALAEEIAREWGLIEGRHAAVANEFAGSYKTLRARERHQGILLGTVSALVAGSLCISVVQLLRYSVPKELMTAALQVGALAALAGGIAMSVILWRHRASRRSVGKTGYGDKGHRGGARESSARRE
ncbi:MAG TPA: hypothetical protein VNZ27_09060 [Rhodanobacter sp.]|jgi:hypothetical protein|nr:hypothetical protein [Rhodanobacter sp.]